METLFIHLVKSSAIALLFLLSYLIFLRKETFFATNRIYLLIGLVASFILPFITLTQTVWVNPKPVAHGNFTIIEKVQTTETPIEWFAVLLFVYLVGMVFFGFRLLVQLFSIQKIKSTSTVIQERDIKHVQSKKELSPFSFFKSIFYCPAQFDTEELNAIIAHEKVHARQHHSFDVLFTQITCIVLWFNPLSWLYKSYIKQNLEFLADSNALKKISDRKQYQYLMLQQAIGSQNLAITNSFYNSLTRPVLDNGIKKRISMLHQNQSKKSNFFKLFVILPFLALFLLAFNVKTEYKIKNPPEISMSAQGKSFDYLINKSTSNSQLQQIKGKLAAKGIDFSYTTVRNENGEIIDIQLNLKGTAIENSAFSMDYNSNSSSPIKDIKLLYKGGSYFIVTDKSSKPSIQNTNSTPKRAKVLQEEPQINSVILEIDKNSKTENLKKDSEFLSERGVKIDFKGIKRNSSNEITAIKVVYDNGDGDKGKYQQNSTAAITPFKLAITFNEDGLTTIDVLGKDKIHEHKLRDKTMVWVSDDDVKTIEIKPHGKHKNVWVSDGHSDIIIKKKGEKHKVIEYDGDSNHTMIWNGLDEIGEHEDSK